MTTTGSATADRARSTTVTLALIPAGIAINVAIGTIVHALKLPLYLDAVGTIAITILAGWRAGAVVGVASFGIAAALINPIVIWYSGTQVVIAIFTHIAARRKWFRSFLRVIPTGMLLGVIAAIVSAPVTVIIFGGITASGTAVITAFLLKSGETIVNAVLLTGLAAEPVDKLLQCALAYWLIRSLPRNLLPPMPSGSYDVNFRRIR